MGVDVAGLTLESAVSRFGKAAKDKLVSPAVRGEPEDQLRAPTEQLLADLAALCELDRAALVLVGESSLSDLKTRPDFAVSYQQGLIGFVELKAPGKGADPRRFKDPHDKEQWRKLQALPNLIYSDGGSFSLWRNGQLVGQIVQLTDDLYVSGAALAAPAQLLSLFHDFFSWAPIPPRTPKQLAEVSARLCRLVRAEVAEQLDQSDRTLTGLFADWRNLLFPEATHEQFADGYAQAVTFGLLLARAQGVSLSSGLDGAAKKLAATHSLIGTALRVLTDPVVKDNALATSVATLSRVLGSVDWPAISKGDPDVWLYFYEDFLAEYDSSLRRKTGSYYTPVEVVRAMTRLVDELLRDRLNLHDGLANNAVTLIDPALGTGTFLLEVVRVIAERIADDRGEGAVPAGITAALSRLIGFEIQLGPFAVAQLRILAELVSLGAGTLPEGTLRTYVTDTLGNPFAEEQGLGSLYEPIARSRRAANRIKREEPVLVVLGNPPYKDKSRGKGGWIESGNPNVGQAAPLADFVPPAGWGVSAHVKHLYNPYVYFWRWATWKVFDRHPEAGRGVICFITVAGFLDGSGFQRMREYLRGTADQIWVIDCSPDGHQADTNTRIFQGVQQPVCIVLAVRDGSTKADEPAPVRFRSLPKGRRTDKCAALGVVSLASDGWQDCPDDWRAPFLPASGGLWAGFPSLDDLLRYSGSGMMPGRTWVIAPDQDTLAERWRALTTAKSADKPNLLSEHKRDRRVDTVLSDGLPGFPATRTPIGDETGPCPTPVRVGYRSFDRQWIIPDKRLINQPNPTLWSLRSDRQLYLTAPHDIAPTGGPAVTFTSEVPDLHHYKGSFGGRTYPLWLDRDGLASNVVPGLLEHLANAYSRQVRASDLFAYLAAVLANPAFPATFAEDLSTPGIRVPLTANADLFRRAVEIGQRVLWLHSYGQRFYDAAADKPRRSPRLGPKTAPKVLPGHAIPGDPEHMPDGRLGYDADKHELIVGDGRIGNVTPKMRNYEVSGVNVLDKWFSYRRRSRDRPMMGDRRVSALNSLQLDHWPDDYTIELIDLLNVLGLLIELEPDQAALLDEIVVGPLVTVDTLKKAGVLPVPPDARKVAKPVAVSPEDPVPLW
ncbi:type ISP restriction/modification enzyme [Micromonospora sp. U21]|uniref:type ISP restriction/modification enzyme n=1 Tax=Micromonospora sp. U21 TaxID=2824899 RepID=UPI001B3891B8|nr:type ISP restriction/modification enzyme [Micromonospora sp. U21]MBQ0902667.1 N-6 DNA methylase [Micromonospora sp. U21]